MKILKKFGSNIRIYRNMKEWSQTKLAKEIGVSTNSISLIEQGKTLVSIPRLFEICEKLEISLFDLFKDTNIVKTKAPKDIFEKYEQLNDTNKGIVNGILTVFIKNQRISEKNEKYNQNNVRTYNSYNSEKQNTSEVLDSLDDKRKY